MRIPYRSISLAASLGGALLNVGLAVKVLASSRSLRWDLDSEADALRVDAVKLVWGLLALYFAAAATASTIGFVGIARVRPQSTRLSGYLTNPTLLHSRFSHVCPLLLLEQAELRPVL